MRVQDAQSDGVTIGQRSRDPANTDAAAGTRHVFDGQRFAERGTHALGQDAPHGVHRSARRERIDYGDRPRRVDLRESRANRTDGGRSRKGEQKTSLRSHGPLSIVFRCYL